MEMGNYEVVRFLDWELVKLIPHIEKYETGERAVFRHWHTGIEVLYFWEESANFGLMGKNTLLKKKGLLW